MSIKERATIRIGRVIMVAAVMGFALGGCGGSGVDKAGGGGKSARKPLVLTLANPFGDTTELDSFVREVSLVSHGTMKIVVRSRWRYGQVAYENGLIGDVRAGRADLGVAGTRAWDSVGVGAFRPLGAPLLIDSYALEERVLRSRLIPGMLSELSRIGLVGLGVIPGPLRYTLGITRPLVKPSDYAGLRIGVQQSRVGSAIMRALGATPIWFAADGSIAGLGGIEDSVQTMQNMGYDRVGRYLTSNVVLWPRPFVLFGNTVALAKLSAAQRRMLVQAASDDVSAEAMAAADEQRTNLAILCRSGRLRLVSASSSDIAALRRAVRPVYTMLERDPQARAAIEQIRAMRAGLPAEPALSCGPRSTSVTVRTPLDGVWEMDTKYGEEPSDPTPMPENYGHWVFVFDNGRFAETQAYLNACTWGAGTFTVKGSEMAWTFTDSGGIPTPGNQPGEFFRFRWSIYRDTATVSAFPGAISPQNFFGKPWHRISTGATARYLSKRCPPPANALPR